MGILGLNGTVDSRGRSESESGANGSADSHHSHILAEEPFIRLLSLERMRTERSRRQFVLMLLDAQGVPKPEKREKILLKIAGAVSGSIRETDVLGWYSKGCVVGVILTDIGRTDTDIDAALNAVQVRIGAALRREMTLRQANEIHTAFHLFPEKWHCEGPDSVADSKLYPDLLRFDSSRRIPRSIKRAMDVVGSAMALIFLSPVFFLISIAIKLTSKGPVIFRQKRIGQYGVSFTFLKFRSMYIGSDPKIHQDYVESFISGRPEPARHNDGHRPVYKLRNDPRITPLGKILRKTSLDELPQFLNVLRGDMSLVGPRPPVPYEFNSYDRWHRSRLLETKPGITGLWQVSGRSKTTFDDMVRLDLRYTRTWSLWLDIKILFKTPWAVFSGEGAY
jgi:exopolysaccharide biosynthesis polyprenyl glycosylphosphotransferase